MDPCIIVVWRCEPPPGQAPHCAQRALNERPVVGRTLQRPSIRKDLAALQSVPLLASLPGPLSLSLSAPPWARPSSFSSSTNASVPIVNNSAACTALAWMKTISPVGGSPERIAFVDKPLVDEHLHGRRLIRHSFLQVRLALCHIFIISSFSILSSLLAAISALSPHTKVTSSTTIFRTSRSSWAHSERTTWTNSCFLPCASVSSPSCPYPP